MGPKDLIILGTALVCCVMYSNGEIALKSHKNALPNERRKIVKLLLRNFPLQESASYHNLVEDDDVGQPIAKGNHMTQYAPAYPYEAESMSANYDNAITYHQPTTKFVKKTKPDLSRFEYALSTILLPPPIQSESLNNEPNIDSIEDNADVYYAPYMEHNENTQFMPTIKEANEDNADQYYEPQMQNSYKTTKVGNLNFKPANSEEEYADQYYIPYMQNEQPKITNNADAFYLPYNQYAQQQQDNWLQYYQPQATSLDELPELSLDGLYEGPNDQLPTLEMGNKFSGPASIDNEIFDVPKILLKYKH